MTRLLDRYERFAFDLDGTVWLGGSPVPGAAELFAELRRIGKRVVFVTNSPERSCAQVADLLGSHGIEASAAEVVTSGRAAAHHLLACGARGERAFIIGGSGLAVDLAEAELEFLDEQTGAAARVVVVGRDSRCTYAMLKTAFRAVHGGARFVGTNRDPTHPIADGLEPGGGALVAAIEYASGVQPVIVGKPERPTLDLIEHALGDGGATLMVGDKPEVDLESARRAGWDGVLVLTGVTSAAERSAHGRALVLDSIADLLRDGPA